MPFNIYFSFLILFLSTFLLISNYSCYQLINLSIIFHIILPHSHRCCVNRINEYSTIALFHYWWGWAIDRPKVERCIADWDTDILTSKALLLWKFPPKTKIDFFFHNKYYSQNIFNQGINLPRMQTAIKWKKPTLF